MATQLNLPGIPLGGGISGALQGLLGSQAVRSIAEWMMLQNLVQAMEGPLTAELAQLAFGQFPTLVSSPVELAAGVVRGHVDPSRAREDAKKSGYDQEPFQLLVDNQGQPLPLQQLFEAWRRGAIPESGQGAGAVSLDQGVRESDLKDKWLPVLKALQWQLLAPADVVAAWVRNQIPEAEARARLKQAGINDPEQTVLYHTTGRPPSPQELADLAHRGVIPWTGTGPDVLSVEQGIHEGDTKDKWAPVYQPLTEYLPPPRTVTAMLREGAIDDAAAAALFKKAGLPPELVQAYLQAAHHQKTAAAKELAKSDLLAAAVDGLMSDQEVTAALQSLGWSAHDAALELALAHFRANKALLSSAIGKIRSLYLARKIDRATADNALGKLGVTADGRTRAFAAWDVDRGALVLRLTPAEWAAAVKNQFLTAEQALSQLQGMGYSAYEAWLLLSNALKGPATATAPPADVPAKYTATS